MAEKVVIGNAELWHGDCREILPTLGRFDVLITDPPYGIDLGETSGSGGKHGLSLSGYGMYSDTYRNYIDVVVPVISDSISKAKRSAIFIGPHIHELPKFDALGGVYCSAAAARHQWGFKNFLPVLLYGKYPNLQNGAKVPTVLASNESAEKNGHPVPKPIGWLRWLLSLASIRGEVVFDPFAGSGTTGVAAAEMGRRFIGVEIDKKYFDIACERISRAYAQGQLIPHEEVQPVQASLV